MKFSSCFGLAGLALVPFVRGQAAAGGGAGVVVTPPPVALPTLVWVTGTINGVPTVTQSPYTQTFSKFDGVLPQPKSGSIGLGTISGEIGITKTIVEKRSLTQRTAAPVAEKRDDTQPRIRGRLY